MPGADIGLQAEDPTIAELLKPLGYATGQFGKNHLGDLNKYLPTVARLRRVLRQPLPPQRRGGAGAARTGRRPRTSREFSKRFGPRGVIHSWATDEDDDTEEPRFGRVGKQRIEDTGPLTKKRMETIDDEVLGRGARLHRAPGSAAETPFFVWFNTTHMHFRTHPKPESVGQAGRWQSPYHDTMIDHDKLVGAAARQARRARDRRQHDRHLLDRQRAAHEHVAGRRHDAVPQREEHELGRRLPRAGADPLAREDPGRRRSRTRSSSTTTGCRRSSPRPASPDIVEKLKAGHTDRRHDLQGAHRRLQPGAVPDRRGRQEPAARAWSTSPTTATCSRSGSTTGRSSSWSSGRRGRCGSGRSRSSRSAFRSCSTCAPTRSSART